MTVPTNVQEWLALPEVVVPRIQDPHKESGAVFEVTAIGFVRAAPEEVRRVGLPIVVQSLGDVVALPTATLRAQGADSLHRLPLGLAQWALDIVALTLATGETVFPTDVEFCEMKGRMTADIR